MTTVRDLDKSIWMLALCIIESRFEKTMSDYDENDENEDDRGIGGGGGGIEWMVVE